MTLNECARGDLVVIEWPHGSDYSTGTFGDLALRGEEVFCVYAGPMGAPPKKRHRGDPEPLAPNAYVHVADPDTGQPYRFACRVVANVEVLAVVESRHSKVSAEAERAVGRMRDEDDPLIRARSSGF